MSERFLKYETENEALSVDEKGVLTEPSWDNLKDKPFGVEREAIVLFDEDITLTSLPDDSQGEYQYTFPTPIDLVPGQEYLVTYDGYTEKITADDRGSAMLIWPGTSMQGGMGSKGITVQYPTTESGRLTVVSPKVIRKLDAQFIPGMLIIETDSNIVRDAEVAEVIKDAVQNGQMLCIYSNGKYYYPTSINLNANISGAAVIDIACGSKTFAFYL